MLNAAEGAEVWSRVGSPESTGVVGAPFPAMRGGEVILGGLTGKYQHYARRLVSFYGRVIWPCARRARLLMESARLSHTLSMMEDWWSLLPCPDKWRRLTLRADIRYGQKRLLLFPCRGLLVTRFLWSQQEAAFSP